MAQTEKPLICSDPYADARFSRHFDATSGFRTRSILCVPLRSRGRLVGVVEVINKKNAQDFTDEDLEILTMLGNMIGPALENAQLYSRLKEKLSLTREELKVVENKLLQTERLAALGKLSRGVAHEVRNPVMIIGGFTHRLQKHLPVDDPAQEMIAPILHELRRLERMVAENRSLHGPAGAGHQAPGPGWGSGPGSGGQRRGPGPATDCLRAPDSPGFAPDSPG